MYIPVPFCKFILRIASPAPMESIIFLNWNFKINRSSTIKTGIKTKYNLPTAVFLFKPYIYTIYYNNNSN